jgi:hypothetical protein
MQQRNKYFWCSCCLQHLAVEVPESLSRLTRRATHQVDVLCKLVSFRIRSSLSADTVCRQNACDCSWNLLSLEWLFIGYPTVLHDMAWYCSNLEHIMYITCMYIIYIGTWELVSEFQGVAYFKREMANSSPNRCVGSGILRVQWRCEFSTVIYGHLRCCKSLHVPNFASVFAGPPFGTLGEDGWSHGPLCRAQWP